MKTFFEEVTKDKRLQVLSTGHTTKMLKANFMKKNNQHSRMAMMFMTKMLGGNEFDFHFLANFKAIHLQK